MRGEGVLGMFRIGLAVTGLAVPLLATAAAPYRAPADLMADWLVREQSLDGSFGTQRTPECQQAAIRPLCTVEALAALDRLARRNLGFRLGQAWLANNAVAGHELQARQAAVLGGAGGETARLAAGLAAGQSAGAWGLSAGYQGSAWDTAAVTASANQIPTSGLDLPGATTWLLDERLPTGGWSIGTSTAARLSPTALAVEALASRAATEPAAAAALPAAIATLRSLMATSADLLGRARGVRALAAAGADASSDLQALLAQQNLSPSSALYGSIAGDLRVTAVTAQAVGILLRAEIAADETTVEVPDPALRAAINETLGHGAMDRLTRADLARLTSLDASGRGLFDLTGLEWASNLATCNLANNRLTSSGPIDDLPCRATADLSGNPIPGLAVVQVPLLPPAAWMMLALVLALLASRAAPRATQRSLVAALVLGALVTMSGLWPATVHADEALSIEERQTLQQVSRAVLKGRALEAKRVREAVAEEREALEPVMEELRRLAAAARPPILGSVAPTAAPDPIAVGSGEKVVSRATLMQPPNLPEPARGLQPQGSPSPEGEGSSMAPPTLPPSPDLSAAREPLAVSAAARSAGSQPSVAAPAGADKASLARLDALRQRIATHRASRGGQLQPAPLAAGRAATAVAQPKGNPVPEGAATPAAVDASALDAVLAGVEESLARMSVNEALDHGELQRLIGVLDGSQAIDVADPPALDPTLSTRTRHVEPAETRPN